MKLKKLLNEIGISGGLINTSLPFSSNTIEEKFVKPTNEYDKTNVDPNNISQDSLREVLKKISEYNTLREKVSCSESILESANSLNEIATHAESIILRELKKQEESSKHNKSNQSGLWMEANTAKRHCNELKKLNLEYNKHARKVYESIRILEGLYEDAGKILETYFEIK